MRSRRRHYSSSNASSSSQSNTDTRDCARRCSKALASMPATDPDSFAALSADALAERVLPGLAEAPRLASLASLDAEGADGVDLSAPEATANPRAVLLAALNTSARLVLGQQRKPGKLAAVATPRAVGPKREQHSRLRT